MFCVRGARNQVRSPGLTVVEPSDCKYAVIPALKRRNENWLESGVSSDFDLESRPIYKIDLCVKFGTNLARNRRHETSKKHFV